MNYVKWLLVVALAAVLTGCYPLSIQPFFTQKDLVYDPALVGVWKEADSGTSVWTIRRGDATSYEALNTEDGDTRRYQFHLVQLGDARYLDIVPLEEEGMAQHIPAHSLHRIRISADVVEIEPLSLDYFDALINAHKTGIAQKVAVPIQQGVDNKIVLTGSTAELQEFVLKHAREKELFAEMGQYKRMR